MPQDHSHRGKAELLRVVKSRESLIDELNASHTDLRTTLARLTADLAAVTAERDEARAALVEAKNALRDCGELVAFVGCTRTDDNETPTDLDAFPCCADDSPVRSKPDEWCEACVASDSISQVIHGHSVRARAHLGRSE